MTLRRFKFFTQDILFTILIFSGSTVFPQNKVERYSLDKFCEAVSDNNLQIKISQNTSNLASLSVREARSQLLPQADAQAEFRRFFNDQLAFFEFPNFENIDPVTGEIPVETQSFKVGFDNNFQGDVVIEQSLLNVKQIYNLKAAQYEAQLGHLQHQDTQNKILAEAQKTFLQAALMQQVYEVNQESERNAKVNYEDAQNQLANGLISELEMLQAKIGYEEEIPNTLQSARNYKILLGNLKFLAGLSPEDSIVIDYDLADFEYFSTSTEGNKNIQRRPDYQILEQNIGLQDVLIRGKRADYLPMLTVGAGYSYASTSDQWDFTDNRNKFLYANLSLTIPIYSGGYRTVQLEKAKIEYNSAVLQKQEAKLSMGIEIKNLALKLAEEYQTILSTQSTLASVKKAFEIAQSTLENGLIPQLDFRRIKNDYKKAEIDHYFSIYNYKSTAIDYQIAIGNFNIKP